MILYFDDSAFLTISSLAQRMEMKIGETNDAKYYMHQTQDSFKSLHLLACRWELRETIAHVVISSMLG